MTLSSRTQSEVTNKNPPSCNLIPAKYCESPKRASREEEEKKGGGLNETLGKGGKMY